MRDNEQRRRLGRLRHARSARRVVFGSILLGSLPVAPGAFRDAGATHQVDHRYTLVGEVRTTEGAPVAGESVKITAGEGKLVVETRTDTQGRYRMVLHLHNPDLGKMFDVVVRDRARTARVQFNRHDSTTERGQRLDFVVPNDPAAHERKRMIIVPGPRE